MNSTVGLFFSFLLAIINQFNFSLESAFLQNDPAHLAQLFTRNSPVLITLAEPYQISDFFSHQQARLIMNRLFRQTATLEFFIDQENQPVFDHKGVIIQARWSMVDRSDRRKYLFRVYLYVFPEREAGQDNRFTLRIREFRAEKR